jgi:hypothetical protein
MTKITEAQRKLTDARHGVEVAIGELTEAAVMLQRAQDRQRRCEANMERALDELCRVAGRAR